MHKIECFCACSPVDGVVEEDEFAFVHPLVFLKQRSRMASVSIYKRLSFFLLEVLMLVAGRVTLFALGHA